MTQLETTQESQLQIEGIRYEDTLRIIESLGPDRISMLQTAIGGILTEGEIPTVANIVDHMVDKHSRNPNKDLSELGIGTIADSLTDILEVPKALKAMAEGSLSINGAVKSHKQRIKSFNVLQDPEILLSEGTADTETIYIDEETQLYLVKLTTVPHLIYEGFVLNNCLKRHKMARNYLERGVDLFSLRHEGIEPKVTIEARTKKAEVTQARGQNDDALHTISPEYGALLRSLGPMATRLGLQNLQITDGKYEK